ncbi:hypothetical protein HK098_004246 [Nowakowskiella sp. JEL0407]|nr:hypothetical protein HK098_004246 [Nowakowskiella sp. JEL0407]
MLQKSVRAAAEVISFPHKFDVLHKSLDRMKIFCKLGDSASFPVDAEPTTTVGDLKDYIKKKKEPELDHLAADKLLLVRVFERGKTTTGVKDSTKTEDVLKSIANGVLAAQSPERTDYEGTETTGIPEFLELPGWQFEEDGVAISAKVMNPSYKLSRYALTKDTEEGYVDILVILPAVQMRERPISTYSTISNVSISHLKRKERWDALNVIVEKNKKAKVKQEGEGVSTGYSYISWKEVEPVFKPLLKRYTQARLEIPDEEFNLLYDTLKRVTTCYGYVTSGKEAKRVHFISPILVCVSYLFHGDIQILVEEDVDGNNVHVHGHFEYVLQRGDKRICIVEAKLEQMNQGTAQNLLGCEALSDVERLSCVYGIVTNFLEWRFFKSMDEEIFEDGNTITFEDPVNLPTKDSLRKIAEKIHCMLSE